MDFADDRKTMYEGVRVVSQVTRCNSTLPEISGVLIEAHDSGQVHITGTNIRTCIQKRIVCLEMKQSGKVLVTAHLLANILKLMPNERVTFQKLGNMITIKSRDCIYTLPLMNADKFPEVTLPFPKDTIRIIGVSSLIKNTAYATADSDTNVIMQSVKLSFSDDISKAAATDGYRMALTTSPCADGELQAIIHKDEINLLNRIIKPNEELFVGVVGKHITFFNQGFVFSTSQAEGDFPDIDMISERYTKQFGAKADSKELAEAVDSIATCFGSGDDKCINILVKTESIELSATTSHGVSKTVVSASYCTPTPESGFNYNPSLLSDFLQKTTGPIVLSFDSRGLLMLEANARRYIVMARNPVKVRKAKPKTTKSESKAKAA